MKKVLMIVKVIEKNGIINVVQTYCNHVNKAVFKVDIITGEVADSGCESDLVLSGCDVKVVPNRNSNLIFYMLKLIKIIREGEYDIVHVHGNSALIFPELLAAKLAKCKVRIAHSHNTKCDHPVVNKFVQPLFNCLYTHALACSVEAGKWMFKNREFEVINNSIDTKKFVFNEDVRNRTRKELGVDSNFVIGHIGWFNYQKNHEFLIEVFKEIAKEKEEAVLLLIGVGDLMSTIKEKVELLGLTDKVIFYGSSNDVKALIMAMDVFVFPSRFEGLGIVLIEAQASGLKCFASDSVPKLANVTGNVEFYSLEKSACLWAKDILDSTFCVEQRKTDSEKNVELIKTSGFDVLDVIKQLQSIYKEH